MKTNTKKKERNWIIKSIAAQNNCDISNISDALGLNHIVAKLLYNRGYTDAASAKAFVYMETEMLADPFLLKDVEKAISRITLALERNERITIYGDYDVDGVTSVCTLYLYLKSLGARVDYYIPNRAGEGYGISCNAIDSLKADGCSLIISVDTGITAIEEVDYASSIGVDFIITDHHESRTDIPRAAAVINPHRPDCPYPFKELAGVGVVFKLICAYEERVRGVSRITACKNIFSSYADLVAIGTIADVMPIKGENRIIVKYGLGMLENNPRMGISALIDASSGVKHDVKGQKKRSGKITSGYVGYTLAPRINAAGRIKTASRAVELFLSEEPEKARAIAEELCETNKERQAEENKIMKEAYKKLEDYDIENNPVIVFDANNWHHGVIGIVSSRITEKYSRPSILVSFEGNDPNVISPDDVGKGSGRSIKGMNLVDALCHCEEHLVKYGGHELAAGLSVKRSELAAFRQKINEYAKANLTGEDMIPTMDADCEISFADISLDLAKQLQILEPYGVSNPVPTFVIRRVNVVEILGVSDNKHTKLIVGDGRRTLTCMYFSNSPTSLGVYVGDKIDVLFNIDINEWAGRENLQVIVRDLKISEEQRNINKLEKERFLEIWQGGSYSPDEDVLPMREDFVMIYKLLLNSFRAGVDTMSHREILAKLRSEHPSLNINYIKLKFIVMILKELNIVSIEDISDEVYKFSVHYSTQKTMLDKSTLLRKLRSQMSR